MDRTGLGSISKWVGIASFHAAFLLASAVAGAGAMGWALSSPPAATTEASTRLDVPAAATASARSISSKSSVRPSPGKATNSLAGPIAATVLRVVDGDTLLVRAHIWVDQEVRVAVRLRGVDTPETRAGCAAERALAARAAEFTRRAVAKQRVRLSAVSGGKYFGRVLADVTTADGRALGPELVAAGLARPYESGARTGWCGGALNTR